MILHNFYESMLDYFPPWESRDDREHRVGGMQRVGEKVQETNFTISPGLPERNLALSKHPKTSSYHSEK